ncbi:MAG: hypothetical protein WAN36_04580, partial [Calditrichia bacterium]
ALYRRIFRTRLHQSLRENLERAALGSYRLFSNLQKLLGAMRDSLGVLENHLKTGTIEAGVVNELHQKITEKIDQLRQERQQELTAVYVNLLKDGRAVLQEMVAESGHIDVNRRIKKIPHASSADQSALSEIPQRWSENKSLLTNFTVFEIRILGFQNRLKTIFQKFETEVLLSIENNPVAALQKTGTELQELAENPSQSLERKTNPHFSAGKPFRADVQALRADLREAAAELPDEVVIVAEEFYQRLEEQPFQELEALTLALRRLMDYLLDTALLEPLQSEFDQFSQNLEQSLDESQDIRRLMQFQISNLAREESPDTAESLELIRSIANDSLKRISAELNKVHGLQENLQQFMDKLLKDLFEKMNPYVMMHSAARVGQYIRVREGRKMLTRVETTRSRIQSSFKNLLVRIYYRKSQGVLLAKQIGLSGGNGYSRMDKMLSLAEALHPKPSILKSLPLFYRQLYLGKPLIGQEFRVNRVQESEKADAAFRRYKEGYAGGLLITGETNSGKSTISNMLAIRYSNRQPFFVINPPPAGDIELSAFEDALSRSLNMRGTAAELFEAAPAGSVFIFNDLESWWERSPQGWEVIDFLMEMMDTWSHRCFFIINMNLYAYNFINRVRKIEDHFLGVFPCSPMDAEELKEVIMLRHASSGLLLEYKGQAEGRISGFRQARLFGEIFNISRGNVGVALHIWISLIDKISENRLFLHQPQMPSLAPLDDLDNDWMILLSTLVLHRRLSVQRLLRITGLEQAELQPQVAKLKRSGLITENRAGVLETDPYLHPFLVDKLKERRML